MLLPEETEWDQIGTLEHLRGSRSTALTDQILDLLGNSVEIKVET